MAAELWDTHWLAQKDGAVQGEKPDSSEHMEHVHFQLVQPPAPVFCSGACHVLCCTNQRMSGN